MVSTNAIARLRARAPPEEPVAEAGGDRAGNEQDEGVVDDLHRRDRDGVGSEGNADSPAQADAGCQHRSDRQRVAEEEREKDRERDRGGVTPAERGRDHHSEHLADRTAGQAVQRRLDCAVPERDRLFLRVVVMIVPMLHEALGSFLQEVLRSVVRAGVEGLDAASSTTPRRGQTETTWSVSGPRGGATSTSAPAR